MLLSNQSYGHRLAARRWTHPLCGAAVLAVTWITFAFTAGQNAAASQVRLKVGVAKPTMMSGQKETNYVRIALRGSEIAGTSRRPPLNVAIVIDNSGSMSGTKIEQARQAAIAAVRRLGNDDIVSVVLYNNSVHVLVPATKATDRSRIIRKINEVRARGGTALFAGVSKGAAEVRKFLDSDFVNRVILLSDGRANVGPQSPRELERLGLSLLKEGISVSTLGLGLGYNEDLMSRLASAASGNHIFVEQEDDLVAVFNNEFSDLMSVVASDFRIRARVGEGVRPVRVLGTEADITGREIYIPLAQLYANQERYFVLELEVSGGRPHTGRALAEVDVEYQNMITEKIAQLSRRVDVRFTDQIAEIESDRDHETTAYCAVQIANERNMKATELRDAGLISEAKKLLSQNVDDLSRTAESCRTNNVTVVIPELEMNIKVNRSQVELVEQQDWNRTRKAMRATQSQIKSQQRDSSSWYGLRKGNL